LKIKVGKKDSGVREHKGQKFENAHGRCSQFSHISVFLTTWQLGRASEADQSKEYSLPHQTLSPRPAEPLPTDGLNGNKKKWKMFLFFLFWL